MSAAKEKKPTKTSPTGKSGSTTACRPDDPAGPLSTGKAGTPSSHWIDVLFGSDPVRDGAVLIHRLFGEQKEKEAEDG